MKAYIDKDPGNFDSFCAYLKVKCGNCSATLGKYFITCNDLILGTIYIDKQRVKEVPCISRKDVISKKIQERKKLIQELRERSD